MRVTEDVARTAPNPAPCSVQRRRTAPRVKWASRMAPIATSAIATLALSGVAAVCGWVPMARAQPLMNGVFAAHYASGTSTWTITSGCDPAGCTAHVVSDHGWSRDAQYSGQQWTMVWPDRPDGLVCPDGSTVPGYVTWSWDGQTLSGQVVVAHGAGCGNPPTPPGVLREPFSLARIG